MIGKVVRDTLYIHKSAFKHMTEDIQELIQKSLIAVEYWIPNQPMYNCGYDLISINMKNRIVSFIGVPTFDDIPEPAIEHRITVKWNDNEPDITHTKYTSNPQIIHCRYMMVDDDYRYFDIQLDKHRVECWKAHNPDYRRIGRQNYWHNWLDQINLPQKLPHRNV